LATLVASWRRINEFQIELNGVVMNQKSVNLLSLISGFLGTFLGLVIAYRAISTEQLWPNLWGGIGIGVLGLDSLLDKRINTFAKSFILIIGILCLAIYIIGLLS